MRNLLVVFFGILLLASPVAGQTLSRAAPPVTALAISPDGAEVLAGSQAGVLLHAWPELRPGAALATELAHVHDLAFSPQGDRLLLAGGSPGEEGVVEVWSWPEKKRLAKAVLHRDVIYRARWSAEGAKIVTASADGAAQIVQAEDLQPARVYQGHSRAALDALWLEEGALALSAGVDQTIQCWEAATGERRRTLSNHVGAVNALALRPQQGEETLILASISEDRTLRLWQPAIGRLMRFVRLPSPPRAVCWAPTGEAIYVACNDGVIRVLNFDDLATLREMDGEVGRVHELVRHPTAKALIAAGERGIRVIPLDEVK